VTSLPPSAIDGRTLYERVYCARGEMENRIKEQQLDLFADRTSAASMRANQLRLWFASFAYVLLEALRGIGLRHSVPGRHLRHDPLENPQARRQGHGLGAPDQAGDRLGLPLAHRVRARPSGPRALDRPAARPRRCLSRSLGSRRSVPDRRRRRTTTPANRAIRRSPPAERRCWSS
jgi:hypothetical protein